MVDTGLRELIPAVEIVAEDVVIEHSAKPYADSVRHIQELVSADVGQHSQCSEYACPLADLQRIGLKHNFLWYLANPQLHQRVDVSVDVGQIHERAGMQQSDNPAIRVFLELWLADGPKAFVLILEVEIRRVLGGEAIVGCL